MWQSALDLCTKISEVNLFANSFMKDLSSAIITNKNKLIGKICDKVDQY